MATIVPNEAATVLGEAGILLRELFTWILPTALFWIICPIVVVKSSGATVDVCCRIITQNFRRSVPFEHWSSWCWYGTVYMAYILLNVLCFFKVIVSKLDEAKDPGSFKVALSFVLAMTVVHISLISVVATAYLFGTLWQYLRSGNSTHSRSFKVKQDRKMAEDFGAEKVVSKGEERAYINDSEDTLDDWRSVSSDGDDGPSFLERMDEHHAMNKRSLAVVSQRGQERTADYYGQRRQGTVQQRDEGEWRFG
ncbi:hypothetical protein LTR56_013258 [Elasticomyces elasticus]|nr:hypothetical protein LTR56_013258 [Elasticomyces elasticus]KAK3650115.1 hypothetical protein LTR22_012710 [Elasticomyces elasticus]KAK4920048.1 hypothetical protein LTR49_012309 [Elasticomyces elasticus]KAK5757227.1 hypothetical protein LTS12_012743 [Elasticomyces elasticus]